MRIGERAVEAGLISAETLERVLSSCAADGELAGQKIARHTAIKPLAFYQTLSQQLNLPFLSLNEAQPDINLMHADDVTRYIQYQAIPLRKDADGALTLVTCNPSGALTRWASHHYASPVRCIIATPRDIATLLLQRFGRYFLSESCFALYNQTPYQSAYHTFHHRLPIVLIAFFTLLCIAAMIQPHLVLSVLLCAINLCYCVSIGFKWLLFAKHREAHCVKPLDLSDTGLPVYTILIPLYKEANSIPGLMRAMRHMHYPKHKLDIKLILEADDDETYAAILKERPENYFDILRVPKAEPRTKPKACNYALHFARGHYVTIYDAEDRPDPNQLREAVSAFRQLPDHIVCLQARLNYYNWHENWLTRCFAIEYASLFDIQLPGLHALKLPIPLGGTSNHFHMQRLKALGEWDPFNVTEDADLGIRLAAEGYGTAMLPSTTMEEAPIHLSIWLKQRSRWLKGYIQTWLVHMRQQNHIRTRLGWRGFIGLQLFVGLPTFIFLCAPFFWLLFILSLLQLDVFTLPAWLAGLSLFMLAFGAFNHWFFAAYVTRQWAWHGMVFTTVTYPFYWFLHIWASFIALYQLFVKPHYWEKTPHGLSKYLG